jgi:hypothetical protein
MQECIFADLGPTLYSYLCRTHHQESLTPVHDFCLSVLSPQVLVVRIPSSLFLFTSFQRSKRALSLVGLQADPGSKGNTDRQNSNEICIRGRYSHWSVTNSSSGLGSNVLKLVVSEGGGMQGAKPEIRLDRKSGRRHRIFPCACNEADCQTGNLPLIVGVRYGFIICCPLWWGAFSQGGSKKPDEAGELERSLVLVVANKTAILRGL